MSKSHHHRFLVPTQMEAQFDAFFMNVASQCSSIASNEHHGNAINIMHEAYFGFLRRKTDFFSSSNNEEERNRGKTSVLKALEKQREEVEKSKTSFEREKEETEKRKHKEMVKKKEREDEMRGKLVEEEKKRKERVREALMAQKMEEAKKKIVELDEDGNEVMNDEEEDKDEQQKVARENTEKVEKEEEDPHALQPGTVHPSPLNGGEAEHYVWSQTLQEVDVRLPVPVGTRAKDIVCEFTATTFKFGLKSEPALRIPEKSKLCESIKPDDSFWTLEDNREVRLTLTKSNQMSWWENVIKGDPRIDTKKVVPENSNLADLDGETRSTVEKMMYDQRQKAAGKPTSDQESKMGLMKKFMESHPEMDFSNCKFDDGVLPAGAFNGQ